MDDLARFPLARAPRREVQRTFRLPEALDKALQNGAVAERCVFSEYVRHCLIAGHNVLQAQRTARQIGA